MQAPRNLSAPQSGGPDFSHELTAFERGARQVAGVDEAGRGPLAGPVVAAAVILDPARLPRGLNDSKKLSEKRRVALYSEIMASACVGVGVASPALIDEINILQATLWAMGQALANLTLAPDLALVDGRDSPHDPPCPARCLIGGDGRSLSIAAASIIAKVRRDAMCQTLDLEYPLYGFARHKGYGTKAHLQALAHYGPTPHHRKSFAPVQAVLTSS